MGMAKAIGEPRAIKEMKRMLNKWMPLMEMPLLKGMLNKNQQQ